MNNIPDEELRQVLEKKPRVLFFDIETTPHKGFFYGHSYDTDIFEITEYGSIYCYSYGWEKEKPISRGLIDTGVKKGERPLIKEIWKLFNEADIIIGHNIKDFDDKWCRTKFLLHGLNAPSPYKTLDTKTEAKKYIKLPNYKLDTICKYFGGKGKEDNGGKDNWKGCVAGDVGAWKKCKKYSAGDINALRFAYDKLLPLMANHPQGQYIGKERCEKCGSEYLVGRGKVRSKNVIRQQLQCRSCGGWQSKIVSKIK